MAIVEGTLSERDQCLLIGDFIAVFPMGTGWDEPSVKFSDGEAVVVGDHVRLSGGIFDVADLANDADPVVPATRVQACADRTGSKQYAWAMPMSSK